MDLEEEPVWQLFGKCGSVTNVRLVRDRVSNMGKGIGYVTFASKDSVDVALKLAGTMLGSRPVRVSPCSKIGMVEKKKTRAKDLAEKRQKQAAALVKTNPSAPSTLGAAKGTSTPAKDAIETDAPVKVSKKEAKLQAELQTKFGQLFHKKFPFAQAISEVNKDTEGSSKVVAAKVTKSKSSEKKSTDKTFKKSAEKSNDKSSKKSSDKSAMKSIDKSAMKPADKSAKKPTDKSAMKPTEKAFKKSVDTEKKTTPFKPTKIAIPTSRPARVEKPKSDSKSKK